MGRTLHCWHSSLPSRHRVRLRAKSVLTNSKLRNIMQFFRLLLLFVALGSCVAAPWDYFYGGGYSTATRRRAPPTTTTPSYKRSTAQSTRYSRQSSTKSDKENAKFAGAANQELDDLNSDAGDERTLLLKKKLKKLYRPYASALGGYGGYGGYGGRPCVPFGRDAGAGQKDPAEQGRFLFDLNVYNVYPGGGGCRGYGGGLGGGLGGLGALGGLGGGLLSDPIAPVPVPVPVRPYAPFATWLSLFAPGILQNSLAATVPLSDIPVRPASAASDPQSDPAVDPNYNPPPVRRPVPNRVYYDSAGAVSINRI